jgi:hypothetical protein
MILLLTACRSRNDGIYYKYQFLDYIEDDRKSVDRPSLKGLPKWMAGRSQTGFIPTFSIGLSSHASRAPCRSEYIARRLCADLPLPVFAASGEYQIGIGSQTIDDPPCPASQARINREHR